MTVSTQNYELETADPFGVFSAVKRARERPGLLTRARGLALESLVTCFALSPLIIVPASVALSYLSAWSPPTLAVSTILVAWTTGFFAKQLRLFERQSAPPETPVLSTKKRVVVVGAGPAGLAVTKECLAQGLDVVCFEKAEDIGGVYRFDEGAAGGAWRSMVLTTSPWVTAFSDFPPPTASCEHFTHRQYLEYLHGYAQKFALRERIQCRHSVTRVSAAAEGKWLVDVLDQHGNPSTVTCDHVAVCSGLNQKPRNFDCPGIDEFDGEILHACDYKDPDRFRDKKVLVVGLGESGADIATELAYNAAQTSLSLNHGVFVVPRKNPLNARANDYDTNRTRYATSLAVRNWFMSFKRRVCFLKGDHTEVSAFRAQLLAASGVGPMSQKSVKQDEFVRAAMAGRLQLRTKVARLEKNGAVFEDGSRLAVDCVVFAHGYQPTFPFLDPDAGDLHPGNLYLNMFSPKFREGLVFCGFARPAIGSIPPTAELQARYFSLLAAGKRRLSSGDEMRREITRECQINSECFPALAQPNVVVNWIPYMDTVAGLIGCRPDPRRLLRRPRLLWKVATGPATGAMYRLHGDLSDPVSEKTVLSLPRMHSLIELATLVGLHFWLWPASFLSRSYRMQSSNSFI
jgi:dimethylaniline monooxygenase (N-oxide forming)